MSANVRQSFVLRGWHVLVMLLVFFGVVIAVNTVFITAAVGTFPGEDVPHSYTQGLDYNDTLKERAAARELGWRVGAGLEQGDAGAALLVRLVGKDGAPLSNLKLAGTLRRPAEARDDVALTFVAHGPGAYIAQVGALAGGDWRLRAHAEDGAGATLDFERDLTWRTSQPARAPTP